MTVFSSLAKSATNLALVKGFLRAPGTSQILKNAIQIRQMGGHGHETMKIRPSRFQWEKFKDLFHFYVMLGVIPAVAVVFYANVFIGPAELVEIPEDYTPKYWEYHRHPITRFIARYIQHSPQQDYEKMCHVMFEETEKNELVHLEFKIKKLMGERKDYQAYYYVPSMAKYTRASKEAGEYLKSIRGD